MTPQTNLVLATGLAKPVKQNGVQASSKGVESDDQAFANILDEETQVQNSASNGPRLRSTRSFIAPAERASTTHDEAANADGADGSGATKTAERTQEALYGSSGAALAAAIAFPVTASAAKATAAPSSSNVFAEQNDLPDTGARSLKTRQAHSDRAAASTSASQKSSPIAATDSSATAASGPAASYLPLSLLTGDAKSSAAPLGSATTVQYQSSKLVAGAQYGKTETSSASAEPIDKKTLTSTRLTSSQTHFAPDPVSGMTKSGAAFAFQLATAAPIAGLNKASRSAESTPSISMPAGKGAAAKLATADTSEYRASDAAASKNRLEPIKMPAGTSLTDGIEKATALQERSAAGSLNANESAGAGLTNTNNASTVSTADKASGAMGPSAAAASLQTQPGNAGKDRATSGKALGQSEVSSAPSDADPTVQADDATYNAATAPSQAEASRSHSERGEAFQGSNSQDNGSNGEATRKGSTEPNTGVAQASSAALTMGAALTEAASPSQQVFDAIKDTLPGASGSSTTASTPQSSSEQPLKVITLALSPANLGTVSIELSLKGDQLGVKVQAEPGAAKLLGQDDGALEKLLKSAGYSIQGISVQIVAHSAQSPETTMQPNQNAASSSTSAGENTGQKQQQRSDGQRAEGRQDRRQGYAHNQELGRGGSLYV